jgi:two-component system alkaline phosphatase synthesis response regulator PhoP
MTKTILIIEDEPKIVQICTDYLKQAGFNITSEATGPAGLKNALDTLPDLIVLDLMLPGMDGLDVCRSLRQNSQKKDIPIIMLTARVEEVDKLIGLELGADDYMTKPFSPRELVARVRAVLRRTERDSVSSDVIQVAGITLNRTYYKVTLPDKEVILTPTEFELLAMLAEQPGRVFSRAQLLTTIRGVTFKSYERAIDSHILNLRRKIEPEGGPPYIITVYGVGYKFTEDL